MTKQKKNIDNLLTDLQKLLKSYNAKIMGDICVRICEGKEEYYKESIKLVGITKRSIIKPLDQN